MTIKCSIVCLWLNLSMVFRLLSITKHVWVTPKYAAALNKHWTYVQLFISNLSNQLFEIIFLAKQNISEATTIEPNILAETASDSLSKELQMIPDRTTPIIPVITDLPVITTKIPSVRNIINFEQKSTVQSQAVTHRLATESPTLARSTKKPWAIDYYSPSVSGQRGKPDISEIQEEVPQSTTVISHHATDSWGGVMEDIQTQESVTQIEEIEVGPLVTSMEISKHSPSKEFFVTETPFVSTTMTLESKTEKKTVSRISELVTTTRYEFTMGEDDSEDRTFTVRSGQSTLVFSQIPEIITVSKTSEDTTHTQLEDVESVSVSTTVSPVTVPDNDGSSMDSWEEKQTNGRKTEDFFGQYVSTTPFPSQHHMEVESFSYSGDKRLVKGISTAIYPSAQTEKTQGRERTETLRPEMRTDTYTNNEIREKITEDAFTEKIKEEVFSGMKFPTASSEQILTESSVEITKSFESPAVTTTKLSMVPTKARYVEEDFTTPVRLERDGYQDITKDDGDITTVHFTHSTLNGEVVTVSKWPWDEDNTTAKPFMSTEHSGSPKLPTVLLTTVGVSGKDKDIPSFTEHRGDKFTLIPDSTQKPLEKFTEEDITDHEKFTIRFQPTTSIGIAEKSTLRDSTTEERVLPITSTAGQVIHATIEGSALDEEDVDVSKPVSTVSQFTHTSDMEGSAFVNYSSTQEPTTYVNISHTIPLSIIPKTEWGMPVSSMPSEGEVLGEPSQGIHVIDRTHLEATISPETVRTTKEITLGRIPTQEEFPWEEQTPVPALSSTAGTAKEATPPSDEQESDGSAFTVSEDQLVTDSERVPVLETTPIGKIEPKAKTDEGVTLTPSMGPKVSLSPGPTQKYEREGTRPREIDRLHTISSFKTSSASTEKLPFLDREPGEETTSDMVIIAESTSRVPPTTVEDVVAKETETDIDREYFTTSSTPSATQPTRPPTEKGKEAFRPQPFSTPEPPTGTKSYSDINIFIIEVRENKTGKSLLFRHTSQSNQHFILKITFGKKKKSTCQMLPLEDNWSVKKFCVLASIFVQELEECVKQFGRMLDTILF